MTMCQENFHLKYRPGQCLSVYEGGCGFRGKVKFLTYNKDNLISGQLNFLRWLTQKMYLCVSWTYIVGKMLHCVQRMH